MSFQLEFKGLAGGGGRWSMEEIHEVLKGFGHTPKLTQ